MQVAQTTHEIGVKTDSQRRETQLSPTPRGYTCHVDLERTVVPADCVSRG